MNQQAFNYAHQFTDTAFKAHAAMLKGVQDAMALQFKAIELQSQTAADFADEALEARDAEALRALLEKSAELHREQLERGISLAQGLYGVAQSTAETLGSLARQQPDAAKGAAAASKARKAAAA